MGRREVIDTLLEYRFGKRFVLNLAHCEKMGLIPHQVNREKIFETLSRELDPKPPEGQLKAIVNECLAEEYHAILPFDKPPAVLSHVRFFRISGLSKFMATVHPLLSAEGLSRFAFLKGSDRP